MVDIPNGHLFLGGTVDPTTHERTGTDIVYDSADLTTHGVIVGMTGSGKTGLGICLLEEALLQGIPTLIIDPKGDMGNLLLTFPALAAADFEPWIDPVAAERDGTTVTDAAAVTATRWRDGLAGWGIGPDRIEALRTRAELAVHTPGSTAGIPMNILGSLEPPADGASAELATDEVEGFVSGLLGLVGIEGDPLTSREHILLSNLVTAAWADGRSLDLATLIAQVQQPPMRKLGVIDLDTFFPPADRAQLALQLNGLLASPAFAAWLQGPPLDIERLLWTADGRPRGAVVSIAHLNDDERQFVVTLLLSKLVTWMRTQSGTSGLRALVYMDEVFGFVPPTAMPPAKKPILTILKQARAFGIGMVLSTQNPVDIDYKALSNAGTWMIGRLQTERDKGRLLDGLASASGAVDLGAIDATISGLAKREFVLHSTHTSGPEVFTTRWAMSYLAGPLTREQISRLTEPSGTGPELNTGPTPATAAPAAAALADDESSVAPQVVDGVRSLHLDPAAPWAATLGAVAGGTRLEPALVARVGLFFDETAADLRHEAEWEAVVYPIGEPIDTENIHAVDYDDRDLLTDAPEGAVYVLPDARLNTKGFFSDAERTLRDHLYRNETLALFRNPELKLYSRVGESRDEFVERCRAAADEGVDADADKLRASLETKVDRVRDAIAKAEDKVREAEADAAGRGQEEMVSGVGDLIGSLLGGRRSVRGMMSKVKRAGSKRRMREKAEERVRTAENRLAERVDDLEELEEELAETLEDIQEDWAERAEAVEEFTVGLEKTDISVSEVSLLWIPTSPRA
ncbi:MAG: DUF87 domain-containing protein [Acidimicrobiales bacterium]|nr:DUF87 domain-containing protein [Acidimicrobiales bacterium]